ncbi:MAG: restriction endonuclease subunit S, partial [Pseudomonadales bacterium]
MSDNKNMKPGWKIWRFDQMATNVNVRIDKPSESGMEHYVGLEHLDADSLKIRRWGTPDDVEATKLMFKEGDIIFGRRRAYQRKLGVAEFDGICSAHAMVLRAKSDVVLSEFLPFFMQSDLFMSRAVKISVGSLSPTINWKTMAVQEFALPPKDEQAKLLRGLIRLEECLESAESLS